MKCPYCARLPRAGWTETNCENCGAPTELPKISQHVYVAWNGTIRRVEMLADEGMDYQEEMDAMAREAKHRLLFTQYT